ncbi:MAG TPA: hypothetical protein VGN63_16995 [Flavisolibacter sp.]|jgi:hypothetical protein|nr:hypothetical protein [Flavisolibacter sp.]
MKYLPLLGLFFSLMISSTGYTQNDNLQKGFKKTTHHGIGQSEVAGMKKVLNLTDVQVRELVAVEDRLHTAFFAPSRDSADIIVRKEKMEKLQRDKEQAFQEILTSAQWQAYIAYMEEKKKKAREAIEERRQRVKAQAGGGQG